MNTEETGLRRQQEMLIAQAARKALDQGDADSALSLVEQTTEFWQENLTTLMGVIGFQARNQNQKQKATALFHKHLKLCINIRSLIAPALWLRNPIRARHIPNEFRIAIDARRKAIEPSWDGIWQNPGLGGMNKALTVVTKQPEEVTDTNDCLIAASQIRNWSPWLARYRDLGGNIEDPRYLKLWVSKAVSSDEKPSRHTMKILRSFTRLGNVSEVRTFLRHITPIRSGFVPGSFIGKTPNGELARCALLLYCECERLEHTVEDWIHIAKSAMYLGHPMVERIVQRILAGVERDRSAQDVFDRLTAKNGGVQATRLAREDIGFRGNTIWQSVYRLIPVDANARRILADYSRHELDASW